MLSYKTCAPTVIPAGQLMRIKDGEGLEISALEGQVWITQQGDQRDIVLYPGTSFTLDRNGLAVLVAIEATATVRILARNDRETFDELAAAGIVTGSPCVETPDQGPGRLAA